MTKSTGEQTTDHDSISSSTSIPSRYPSISDNRAAKHEESTYTNYGSLPLEDSGSGEKKLLLPTKNNIPGIIHIRHQMAILLFIGVTAVCAMRQNVSVAMVAMVNDSYTHGQLNGNESFEGAQTCFDNVDENSTAEQTSSGEFRWDAQTQELLLAAFFYGYILTQIPGGWLSDKYGMKWVIGIGFLLSSVCALLGPVSAYAGTGWYFVTRFLSGLGEGVSFPAMLSMWSKWAHPDELSSLSVVGYVALNFGHVLGTALTGFLINLNVIGGWPLTFYIFGTVGCLWFIVWCFWAYSSPSEHPWISKEEREYIEEGLKHSKNVRRPKVPMRSILLSPAMWCLLFIQFTHTLGMFTTLLNLPLYYSEGLRVPIELAGVYSALPFGLQCIIMFIFSHISDALFTRKILSKVATRKLMAAIGFGSGAIFLLLAGFARCNTALSVTFVSIAMGGVGTSFNGHFVALLDISGPFAGSAMGMMNTAGSIGGIVGPYIVGVLTEVQTDITGWQKVLWTVAGGYALGGLTFLIFGTVKLQHWAKVPYDAIPEAHDEAM